MVWTGVRMEIPCLSTQTEKSWVLQHAPANLVLKRLRKDNEIDWAAQEILSDKRQNDVCV